MKTLINFLLTLVLAAVFIVPVTANYFVIKPVNQSGFVAGLKSVSEKEINILPNFRDFDKYVSFSPGPIQNGKYKDVLGITIFQRQRAMYQGLYSIYNVSTEHTLSVEIGTSGVKQNTGEEEIFEQVVISLAKDQHAQPLLKSVDQGATLLQVTKPDDFTADGKLLVGDELVEVIAVSTDGLVVTPLMSKHTKDELVYPEPIVISPAGLANPRTREIVLAPGEKAQVNATVRGTADLLISDRKIEIPLTFKIKAVE